MGDRQYEVILAASARRALASLAPGIQRRIIRSLHGLEINPRRHGAVILAGRPGEPMWRIRVGDYRVLYEIRDLGPLRTAAVCP